MDLPNFKDQNFIDSLDDKEFTPEIINKIIITKSQRLKMLNPSKKMNPNDFEYYSKKIKACWEKYKPQEIIIISNDTILNRGENIDEANLLTIKFKLNSGSQIVLKASDILTIENLIKGYTFIMGAQNENFTENIKYVYNNSNIDYNSKINLKEFFKCKDISINVYNE